MGTFRLLLAIAVVLVHCHGCYGFRPLGAAEAVQTFYIISGFYMGLILTEKYRGSGSYRLFLGGRFARIYPLYWIVALLSAAAWSICRVLTGQAGPLAAREHFSAESCGLLLVTNALIFGQDVVTFTGVDAAGHLYLTHNWRCSTVPVLAYMLVPQAWSLSVELLFYACAPLLVRRGTKTLVSILVASLALRGYIYFHLGWKIDPWTCRFFPTELALFVAGVLAYRVYRKLPKTLSPLAYRTATAVAFASSLGYQLLPAWSVGGVPLKPWAFYLLAWACLPLLFAASQSSSFDRRLGELSYPLYLVHFLPVWFIPPLMEHFGIAGSVSPVVLAVSLGLAAWLAYVVGGPLERARQEHIARALIAATRRSNKEGTGSFAVAE